MTKREVHRRVLHDSIPGTRSLDDILLIGLVLHTHALVLREDVVLDDVLRDPRKPAITLAPLTWTYIAELSASLWRQGHERSRSDDWLIHYQRVVPYEAFEDVPEPLRARATAARDRVLAHEVVERLIED